MPAYLHNLLIDSTASSMPLRSSHQPLHVVAELSTGVKRSVLPTRSMEQTPTWSSTFPKSLKTFLFPTALEEF